MSTGERFVPSIKISQGNEYPVVQPTINLQENRTVRQLVAKLADMIGVPGLKVKGKDSHPKEIRLTIDSLELIKFNHFPSSRNKEEYAHARLMVFVALAEAAVRKYNQGKDRFVRFDRQPIVEDTAMIKTGDTSVNLIDILPKDQRELTELTKLAGLGNKSSSLKKLWTLPVVVALLAGCAKMSLTDRAMAAPVASVTPTTEVTPPPTLTAPPIEPTPKPSVQPTKLLPTPRAVELTAKPTEKPAVVDFSIKYPKKWSKEFVGTEEGLKVPLTAIIDNSVAVAKEIGMTQPANDGLIEFFLKASYYRYKTENHLTLTYDQYLEQVKLGKVGVPIIARGVTADDNMLKERIFDPALGIDIILSSRKLPILWTNVNNLEDRYDFQVDANGKLTIVTTLSQEILDRYKNAPDPPEVVKVIIVGELLHRSIETIPGGLFFNTCIKAENIPLHCKNPIMKVYPDFRKDIDALLQVMIPFVDGKSKVAPFTIVR